jgi:hypothetical protein
MSKVHASPQWSNASINFDAGMIAILKMLKFHNAS